VAEGKVTAQRARTWTFAIAATALQLVSAEANAFEQGTTERLTNDRNVTTALADFGGLDAHPPGKAPDSSSLQAADRTGNPLWAVPLTSLNATRQQPIFSPTRRQRTVVELPPKEAPSLPIVEQPRRPLFALVGAIAGEGEGIAIVVDDATKGVVRLKTGDSHSGWMLQGVRGREATLLKDGDTAVLALPNPPAH
jgi:hypothetical protein